MKQPIRYLLSILLFYMLVFALGKAGFLAYNHASASFNLLDAAAVWWNGLTLDLATSAYLLVVPWLACFVGIWCPRFALRRVLRPYFIIVGLALTIILAADMVLYEHWQFKLDSSIYNYLNLNNGAAESVSTLFLVGCAVALVLLTTLIAWPAIRLTPRSFSIQKGRGKATPVGRRLFGTTGMLLIGALIVLTTFGGRENGVMNVGSAYYSPRLFLNHAAVNPAYSLLASTTKMRAFNEQFRYFPDEECQALVEGLYPENTDEMGDTLLRVRPKHIVVIQLESFGAQFIAELGGLPDVCPNLSRYISQGVLFDNCYANSFRTDRGTVSAFSGHISYPTASLMKFPEKEKELPSLAHALAAEGYTTDYTYGGSIATMGKGDYLRSAGFQQITSEPDFHLSPSERTTWGASDERVFSHVLQSIKARPDTATWFTGFQNIDSHEPFEVPYHRLDDKVQNAFAYTDHCLGQFLDSLRATPLWDDLLIVLYADHGLMYRVTYEDPAFFHIPLIWLGGAVAEPRRIHTLMNQSDMAATLLSQLGISHRQFPWSRNVLSPAYTQPFAYSTYPSGIMMMDPTGTSIYDTNADRTIVAQPAASSEQRVKRAKALLQHSYDLLHRMGR